MADRSYFQRKAERARIAITHPVAKAGAYITGGFAAAVAVAKPGMQAAAWVAQEVSQGLNHVPWEFAGGGAATMAAIVAGAGAVGAMRETSMGPEKIAKRSKELEASLSGEGPQKGPIFAARTASQANRRRADRERLAGTGRDQSTRSTPQQRDRGPR